MTTILQTPSPAEQLKFLKNLQKILYLGAFTSTYKLALLMSLARLSVEQGVIGTERLKLKFTDIAQKFIELYWQQTTPYKFICIDSIWKIIRSTRLYSIILKKQISRQQLLD